jgi:hypothetical protein
MLPLKTPTLSRPLYSQLAISARVILRQTITQNSSCGTTSKLVQRAHHFII